MSKLTIDLANQRFGRLVALAESGRLHRSVAWLCVCDCDCGKQCRVSGSNLRKGLTRSCGCLRREQSSRNVKRGPTIGVAVRDAAKREAAFDAVFARKIELVRDGDKTWEKAAEAVRMLEGLW